jgi:hypothetical protein
VPDILRFLMRVSPPVLPLRMFFITERAVEKWYNRCHKGVCSSIGVGSLSFDSKLPDNLLKHVCALDS